MTISIVLFILVSLFSLIGLILYSNKKEALVQLPQKNTWRRLALKYSLFNYFPNDALPIGYIMGMYRGYRLALNMTKEDFRTITRLTISVNDRTTGAGKPPTKDEIVEQLSEEMPYTLRGEIFYKERGMTIVYEQPGEEYDEKYLQFLFDLLCDLLTGYHQSLKLGSEIVPALRRIATPENKLSPFIHQWLYAIGHQAGA
ncbi:MAG: hypothetical protein KDJ97_25540 [Anaerolineae bacterium]|nr:hypothetical protein [Anaerolineae bacterium]